MQFDKAYWQRLEKMPKAEQKIELECYRRIKADEKYWKDTIFTISLIVMAYWLIKITAAVRREHYELTNILNDVMHRCLRAGLVMTHHEVARAVKLIGYEREGLYDGTWPASALKAKEELS